jgi:hypothetical protein
MTTEEISSNLNRVYGNSHKKQTTLEENSGPQAGRKVSRILFFWSEFQRLSHELEFLEKVCLDELDPQSLRMFNLKRKLQGCDLAHQDDFAAVGFGTLRVGNVLRLIPANVNSYSRHEEEAGYGNREAADPVY